MANSSYVRFPKNLQKNLAEVFLFPISSLCAGFTRLIKFNRQCLLNWAGRIIVNCCLFLTSTSAAFMRNVFEFLGVPENNPLLESDLEKALVAQIEKFLLELGRGFMFVGTQQRITLNNIHYYVDMVFYNKILRAYVLIELKTTKLMAEAVGQLNMYLNYYAAEVNDEYDNAPIGIILCTDKDSVSAEYALGGMANNIFASRYVSYIPQKEQLIAQVEAVLKDWHEKENK